jgi:hypothetical protein
MVKFLQLAAAALLSAPIVNAHYIFNICKSPVRVNFKDSTDTVMQ